MRCCIKDLARERNEIPLEEMTVSVFRHKRPRKLISMLVSGGLVVRKEAPGIYRIDGRISVPAQIVVMSELEGEEYGAFRLLAEDAREKDIVALLKLADQQPEMVNHIRAILSVSMPLNREVFTKIKEGSIIPEALHSIFNEEFQKERAKGHEEGQKDMIYELVRDGVLSAEDGAKRLGMTTLQLSENMESYKA